MLHIITGYYGTGKTEAAIALALLLKQRGQAVTAVDLDIVNPYFRTHDAAAFLQSQGIKLISPLFAGTNVDIPALPPEVTSVFGNGVGSEVVFDVGGDDTGALALGRYREQILKEPYTVYFVLNHMRPFCKTVEETRESVAAIEAASRLKVSAFINNTHLKSETTAQTLADGVAFAAEVSAAMAIPVAYTAYAPPHEPPTGYMGELLPLSLRLSLPWEEI